MGINHAINNERQAALWDRCSRELKIKTVSRRRCEPKEPRSTLQFLVSPKIGSLSDKYGRKRILLITMVGNILSAVV